MKARQHLLEAYDLVTFAIVKMTDARDAHSDPTLIDPRGTPGNVPDSALPGGRLLSRALLQPLSSGMAVSE